MKSRTTFGIFLAIFSSSIILVNTANNDNGAAALPNLKPGWSNQLDWNLLKVFLSQDTKNVFFSPVSLKIVLSILYEGSSGSTKNELEYVLGIQDEAVLRKQYQNLINILKEQDHYYDVNLETSIFLDSNIQALQPFSAKISTHYNASIEPTNFYDSLTSANKINAWVHAATRGKISKLVSPDDLERVAMLVINALYFKGDWDVQFNIDRSFFGGFYTTPNDVINVGYMKNTGNYYFTESKQLDAKLIRIPFKNNKYSFVALLPKTKGGLHNLISNLNVNTLTNALNNMDYVPVEVILPKFRFNFQTSFASILQDFGLNNMFQNSASFPGIERGSNLYVSNILQKAGIEINEQGGVAYVTSEVQLSNKFGDTDVSFNATHPFAFLIQEHKTGSILFIGKIENPLMHDQVFLPNRISEQNRPAQRPIASTTTSPHLPRKYEMKIDYTSGGFKMERLPAN